MQMIYHFEEEGVYISEKYEENEDGEKYPVGTTPQEYYTPMNKPDYLWKENWIPTDIRKGAATG